MTFVSCMEDRIFPLLRKMANVVPLMWYQHIRKIIKGVLKIIAQFHFFQFLVTFLVAFSATTSFFIENDLIFLNQSGFRQGDSFFNYVISIAQEIYRSMDQG